MTKVLIDKTPEPWERPNHGRLWKMADQENLIFMFCDGYDVDCIARKLGRARDAVAAKLSFIGMLKVETDGAPNYNRAYYLRPASIVVKKANASLERIGSDRRVTTVSFVSCIRDSDVSLTASSLEEAVKSKLGTIKAGPMPALLQEENEVSTPNIEVKTFIAGIDAKELSDDDIFKKIAQLEQQVEAMSKIKNKPKKLSAKINNINLDIQTLVDFVDGRE